MTTYILGISCYYHDSSAAIIKDGTLLAAAQEERFTRKKHDHSFPKNAVHFCLEEAGIDIKQVSHVAFYEKPYLKFERVLYQHLEMFPWSLKTFLVSLPSWLNEKLRVTRAIKKLGFKQKRILFIPHHMTHAASFLMSPFEKAAILTVDGVGEWTTVAYGVGTSNQINLYKEIRFPHSLGLLYSAITAYLGFSVNNSEYKVMGLAAYGNMNPDTNPYFKKLLEVIDVKDDGSFRLDMSFFTYHFADRMPSRKLCELLGGPVRHNEEITKRHEDIAAAVQLVLEFTMTKILAHLHKETGLDDLVMSGGIALNSVYNGKILRNTPFKKVWIQPDPGDGGTSAGAALYAWNSILDNPRSFVLRSPYLGPRFGTSEVQEFLDDNKIQYKKFSTDEELVKSTADLLIQNKVVGWFQGGMEWGPRALGARSILANPLNQQAQELLNVKVKHRERFRPFAPVVPADEAEKYFECDSPVPEITDYMLMVYPVREAFRKVIPAVTHVDGSGRLQTVRRNDHALYYDLLKEFGKRSGTPILINTSFNIRGEPIVCSPYDAYKCMMGTEIDCLVMDKFLVIRDNNLHDAWNSEKYAQD